MRWLSALLLSLLLAVTSVTMAIARGQQPMGDVLTICSADGVETVVLDARGVPVTVAPHLCPDCLSGVFTLDLPTAPDLPLRPSRHSAALFQSAPLPQTGRAPPAAHARGPPLVLL